MQSDVHRAACGLDPADCFFHVEVADITLSGRKMSADAPIQQSRAQQFVDGPSAALCRVYPINQHDRTEIESPQVIVRRHLASIPSERQQRIGGGVIAGSVAVAIPRGTIGTVRPHDAAPGCCLGIRNCDCRRTRTFARCNEITAIEEY